MHKELLEVSNNDINDQFINRFTGDPFQTLHIQRSNDRQKKKDIVKQKIYDSNL